MLTWLLFYTSIFRTRKTPMVDVIDPAGVVRSQAIETDDGAMRLTLNGAENRRTLAGHFIAESFGSSVQHLAFATGDIFATASLLEGNGFRPLAMSPNYYDDIEARFGLDPDLVDRLRAENILYDRDEHGEYFQLYARPMATASSSRSSSARGLRATAPRTRLPDRRAEASSAARGDAAYCLRRDDLIRARRRQDLAGIEDVERVERALDRAHEVGAGADARAP